MFNAIQRRTCVPEISFRPVTRPSRMRRFVFLGLAVLLLAVMSGGFVQAQTNLASISGTITDKAGATIPNCTVTVTSKETGAARSASTGANGFYSFPSLPLGTYIIKAAAPGFEGSATTVELTLNGVSADLTLTVGSTTETVTVSTASEAVSLQTESGTVDQSFS